MSASINASRAGTTEPAWVRYSLIGLALTFMFFFLVLPLAAVFTEALRKGLEAYWVALQEPDAWSAVRLTFLTALIAVPLNLVFGIAAAWAIAKYEFTGKAFLTTLVDLPFSVSPVVAGPLTGMAVPLASFVDPGTCVKKVFWLPQVVAVKVVHGVDTLSASNVKFL